MFIAANSGARIGLAEGVKKSFKVAFKDPSKPENGFDFLYISKDDYLRLGEERKELIAEKAMYDGEEVFKITDIIGSEPDLGVENLKGSGLIAGETSAAYEDIFTMTIVLGRYVLTLFVVRSLTKVRRHISHRALVIFLESIEPWVLARILSASDSELSKRRLLLPSF